MKKLLIVLMLGIFFISMVSAEEVCTASLPIIKQGDTIQLTQVCDNCTYVNLTKVVYPNQSFALLGQFPMTENGTNYNYSFNDTNTVGTHHYTATGDVNGKATSQSVCFKISLNGQNFTTGKAISYLGFILILLFTFFLTLYGAIKIEWKHKRDTQNKIITINNFRYIKVFLFSINYMLMMFLFGLSYKFFNEANIQGFTNFFYYGWILLQTLLIPIIITTTIIFIIIFLMNIKIKNEFKLGIGR